MRVSASFNIFAITAGNFLGWEGNCRGKGTLRGDMSEGNVQEDVLHSRVHGCQAKSNIANSTESVTGAGWFILGRQNDERYVTKFCVIKSGSTVKHCVTPGIGFGKNPIAFSDHGQYPPRDRNLPQQVPTKPNPKSNPNLNPNHNPISLTLTIIEHSLYVSRKRSSFGDRNFVAAGPQIWNTFPPQINPHRENSTEVTPVGCLVDRIVSGERFSASFKIFVLRMLLQCEGDYFLESNFNGNCVHGSSPRIGAPCRAMPCPAGQLTRRTDRPI